MPKKTVTNEIVAAPPVRATRPQTPHTAPSVEVESKPRVKSVTHSKAAAAPAVAANAHDHIARIAHGYWEARAFQPGSEVGDWLRAEKEYLQLAGA
jgi:hypothetical protein